MAAYEVLLLNTAVPQIQAAQAGDTYVVPRDIAFSAALTLSAGTANGVPYLNGSKVLTTGSALTFDGSQLGIGTGSPAARFNVESGDILLRGGQLTIGPTAGGNGAGAIRSTLNGVLGSLIFQTEDANAALVDRMTLDSSGNLGLGVTPSAWNSYFKALQFGSSGGFITAPAGTQSQLFLGANGFSNSAGDWKYINSAAATRYWHDAGTHKWDIASSGTAGNTISWTQAMTLDASGNLGIGTTSPATYGKLAVESNANAIVARSGSSSFCEINVQSGSADAVKGQFQAIEGSTNKVIIGARTNHPLAFNTNDTERARITSGGDFQTSSGNSVMVGGTAARATTAGTNRVDIFDGTAPVGTLANGVSFYSASGEANVMDAAGNATLLSPHDAVTNEWIFRSKHTPTGKVLKIDVERLLKFVNDHFGLDAVHEFIED